MNVEENKIKEELFFKGIKSFNQSDYYDAHEYWEDLWSDYRLEDAKFIQALIQLSVGYFHISNLNRNGAIGLFNKCIPKLEEYSPEHCNIDISNILECVQTSLDYLDKNDDLSQFDWKIVPILMNK